MSLVQRYSSQLDLVNFGFANCFLFFQLVGFQLLCVVFGTSWTYETYGLGNARNTASPNWCRKKTKDRTPLDPDVTGYVCRDT